MMDFVDFGIIALFVIIIFFRIIVVGLVAGVISTYIGLNGLLWWCFAFVMFLVINCILDGFGGGK